MLEHERIQSIVAPIAEKFGVERVALFGSRARGEATATSDYDFLISRGRIDSLLTYAAFVRELEAAFGSHVDVVTDTSSDADFIDAIAGEGIVLYER